METRIPVMMNELSPAGDPLRPLSPEMISQMVKDSVERGQPKPGVVHGEQIPSAGRNEHLRRGIPELFRLPGPLPERRGRVLGAGRKESHGPDPPCAQRPRRDRGAGCTGLKASKASKEYSEMKEVLFFFITVFIVAYIIISYFQK